jgi:protein TonB
MAAPPPPFIPPPEINIAPPPTTAPTITAVTRDAPPAPMAPVIQPPAPPAPKPAAPPPAGPKSARVVCPNYVEVMSKIVYPREALLDGLEGEVLIEFTVAADGSVKDVAIKSSSNRIFNRPALTAVQNLSCQGQGQDARVQAPVSFKIR